MMRIDETAAAGENNASLAGKRGLLFTDTVNLLEKDRPVLISAIHHHCYILVTGDRTHFGPLYGKTIQGVTVLSPAMLAETVVV